MHPLYGCECTHSRNEPWSWLLSTWFTSRFGDRRFFSVGPLRGQSRHLRWWAFPNLSTDLFVHFKGLWYEFPGLNWLYELNALLGRPIRYLQLNQLAFCSRLAFVSHFGRFCSFYGLIRYQGLIFAYIGAFALLKVARVYHRLIWFAFLIPLYRFALFYCRFFFLPGHPHKLH